ncbi:transporter substrate-binding domain-containing protein [Erysipelothrix sp. HDW6C]|uniref:transporter substrate-binding domain-containing protein n=1 Tax=Erysipelothrix sp. HDW6C TaxID=2714930 RepID=UPI00140A5E2D|nr:transporter substrate-binding domain-containing protein [Erysipelothrix sp. HDW6C]QIK68848.1 transporter substrate-binding domain-containing protein [Erysipelothrix sp. HDW6C]
MKKLLIVALATLFVLTGCGSKGSSDDLLTSIKEKGQITVALSPDYAPYEFVDPSKTGDAQYVGADVELAKYIGEKLGVDVVIKPLSFDDIASAVSLKKYDIGLSGFTWTEERAKVIDFSKPYDNSESLCQGFLVKADNDFASIDEINDSSITVAAQNASVQQMYAEKQVPNATIRPIKQVNNGVLDLSAGKVQAVAISCATAEPYIQKDPSLKLSDVKFAASDEDGTMIIVSQGQEDLLNEINTIIEEVKANGLYVQWLNEAKDLALSLGVE